MTTSEKLYALQKEIQNGATILSTAFHEAGHAVLRYLLQDEYQYQEKILSLSINDNKNGFCDMKNYTPHYYAKLFLNNKYLNKDAFDKEALEKQFQKYSMINFAGYHSEFRHRNMFIPYEYTIGDDYDVVFDEIKKVNILIQNNYFNNLHILQWNAATDIILDDEYVWATIEELAMQLSNSMKMDSYEIYTILDKNLKDYKLPDNIFDANYLDEFVLEKFCNSKYLI